MIADSPAGPQTEHTCATAEKSHDNRFSNLLRGVFPVKSKKMFSRFLLLLTLTSFSFGAINASLLYNGDNKVMLSLEKQFKVHILSEGNKMVASFDLPPANESFVSGTNAGDNFGLKISSSKVKGENGTLDSAELNFGITNDQKSG